MFQQYDYGTALQMLGVRFRHLGKTDESIDLIPHVIEH